MSTRLIAGLGNPGPQYALNRHNAGFLVLDALLEKQGAHSAGRKFQADLFESHFDTPAGRLRLVFVRPRTFMNLSGEAIAPALEYYKVETSQLLVLHDEIELPFGDIRLKSGGGHKGQNGLRSIIALCQSAEFQRLRFGVGRPAGRDIAGHVLSNFTREEQADLPALLDRASALVESWLLSTVKSP